MGLNATLARASWTCLDGVNRFVVVEARGPDAGGCAVAERRHLTGIFWARIGGQS